MDIVVNGDGGRLQNGGFVEYDLMAILVMVHLELKLLLVNIRLAYFVGTGDGSCQQVKEMEAILLDVDHRARVEGLNLFCDWMFECGCDDNFALIPVDDVHYRIFLRDVEHQ